MWWATGIGDGSLLLWLERVVPLVASVFLLFMGFDTISVCGGWGLGFVDLWGHWIDHGTTLLKLNECFNAFS